MQLNSWEIDFSVELVESWVQHFIESWMSKVVALFIQPLGKRSAHFLRIFPPTVHVSFRLLQDQTFSCFLYGVSTLDSADPRTG